MKARRHEGDDPGRGARPACAADHRHRAQADPRPVKAVTAQGYLTTLTVPNRVDSVRPAAAFVVETARAFKVPAAGTLLFEVGVTEALTNAVKHGHPGTEDAVIVCEVDYSPRQLAIRVIDGGPGFVIPEPRLPRIAPDEVETLPESGFGLPIIQHAFPIVHAIRPGGRFGVELCLPISVA